MSEYIITSGQIEELNRAHGGMQIVTSWLSAYAIFDTSEFPPLMKSQHLAITLPNVVRCRDCRHFKKGEEEQPIDWCCYFHDEVTPLGFCAWGTKTDFVTCKCGEDIERIGRIQTCPSCGRRLMA